MLKGVKPESTFPRVLLHKKQKPRYRHIGVSKGGLMPRVRRVIKFLGRIVPVVSWNTPATAAPIAGIRAVQERVAPHVIPFDANYPSGLAGMTDKEAYDYLNLVFGQAQQLTRHDIDAGTYTHTFRFGGPLPGPAYTETESLTPEQDEAAQKLIEQALGPLEG